MSLIKLTAIRHPDINHGQPYSVYVNPEHIVLIEISKTSQERFGWRAQQHDLAIRFWEEVQRCDGDLQQNLPRKMAAETEEEAKQVGEDMRRWAQRRDIASSLHAAYGLITGRHDEPKFYPPVECTCIQLAVPNARFTMLPALYVQESPAQVADMMLGRLVP